MKHICLNGESQLVKKGCVCVDNLSAFVSNQNSYRICFHIFYIHIKNPVTVQI